MSPKQNDKVRATSGTMTHPSLLARVFWRVLNARYVQSSATLSSGRDIVNIGQRCLLRLPPARSRKMTNFAREATDDASRRACEGVLQCFHRSSRAVLGHSEATAHGRRSMSLFFSVLVLF